MSPIVVATEYPQYALQIQNNFAGQEGYVSTLVLKDEY